MVGAGATMSLFFRFSGRVYCCFIISTVVLILTQHETFYITNLVQVAPYCAGHIVRVI